MFCYSPFTHLLHCFLYLSSIPPNLRMVVYPAGIAFGGEEEWEFLWQRYKNVNDPYEKSLCLYSLSFSREPWILNRYAREKSYKVHKTMYSKRAVKYIHVLYMHIEVLYICTCM